MSPAEITSYLHKNIPITAAMGVEVESSDAEGLVLIAPLEPNHNHLGTAFGGSLSAIATLAGYGVVWLALGDPDAHVVIGDGTLRFRRPVTKSIRAICVSPEPPVMQHFREEFDRAGRGRLRLQVTIEEDGEVAVEFEGTFIARRQR